MSAAFRFVEFGGTAPAGAAACDGLVAGAELDLSHWPGNATPAALKRDTSVEIALAYGAAGGDAKLVTNNHFDADGVLAVFCLLEPEVARAHEALVVGAAEVGDFGAWPRAPEAYWLESAIGALAGGRADASAYAAVLPKLGELCRTIRAREELWGAAWGELQAEDARAERELEVSAQGPVAIFVHAAGAPELPTAVLAKRAPAGATRWLRAFAREGGTWDYRYELPPHGWADTVVRPNLGKPSKNAIVAKAPGEWVIKGDLGMVGLARTKRALREEPAVVARALASGDRGVNG